MASANSNSTATSPPPTLDVVSRRDHEEILAGRMREFALQSRLEAQWHRHRQEIAALHRQMEAMRREHFQVLAQHQTELAERDRTIADLRQIRACSQ